MLNAQLYSADCTNRMLKVLGSKRNKVSGCWTKQLNKALHDVYCTPDMIVIRLMKLRNMHGRNDMCIQTGCLWRNSRGCDHMVEDIGMEGDVILKPVFKKRYVVKVWMEVTWPTILTTMILPSAKRRRRVSWSCSRCAQILYARWPCD